MPVMLKDAEGVGEIQFRDSDEPSARVVSCSCTGADGIPVIYDLHIRADGQVASLEYRRVHNQPVGKWPEKLGDLEFKPELSSLPEG